MCVSMCEHVSACEYNYYSAHEWVCMYSAHECREQCCRLCDNPILFKMYNEKFRGATYITGSDGVCQFLTTLRQKHCNVIKYDTPVRQSLNHEDI